MPPNDEFSAIHLKKIRFAIMLSKYEEASRLATEALVHQPADEQILCELASCQVHLNKDAEAERIARQAADLGSARGFYILSVVLERTLRWEEAEEAICKAIELEPEEPLYHVSLCRILTDRSKPAEEALDNLLKMKPDNREARLLKAHHCVLRGKEAEAEEILEGILAENARHPAALNNFAVLRHLQGRFVEAEQLLAESLSEYTECCGRVATHNLLTVARTSFPPYAWWQRLYVWLWRAVRFRNPVPSFSQQEVNERVRTVIPLVLGLGFLALLINPATTPNNRVFYLGSVWILGCMTYPLANLFIARKLTYRRTLGLSELRHSCCLMIGWPLLLGLLFVFCYVPKLVEQSIVFLCAVGLATTFFTYAMSRHTRGEHPKNWYETLLKIELALIAVAVVLLPLDLLMPRLLDIQWELGVLPAITLGPLMLFALPVFALALLEVLVSLVFFPLEPLLYES